ncbi:MAG: cobalamin-dependent protein [Clostridiales Family XIII bacterium]|jgi:5-methyltetrahydrofolate--homocysteine methyltransferase|nr:cobalamin-dependent protein [Clostridiales Family XIII bacterium]
MEKGRTKVLEDLADAVERGKLPEMTELLAKGLSGGIRAESLLNDGLIRGMMRLGVKFKNHEVFVPDVLVASRALKKGSEILRPALSGEGVAPIGVAVVATVKGDLHDIGKTLVGIMFEGVGIRVVDLGVDVDAETLGKAIICHKPDIVALSALLNTTLNQLAEAISALDRAGLRRRVRIMVGGSPVTEEFAARIGADGYADDAVTAAQTARNILEQARRER